MKQQHTTALIAGGVAFLVMATAAGAYMVGDMAASEKSAPVRSVSKKEEITWNRPQTQQQPVQQTSQCDDGNIVGHALGGVAGGILGSQIGDGSGQTAATIGGTLGGAYLGGEHIPTRNVTCP